ncbi:hypothetical protein K458DRAFT_328219 [Lentithecium fluviatile CBS 122367]|uniref:Ubiquitin carrier protein n=1 Tax=Lentithecium fluviatile CBS 122367 TaxID=1168545 RepID=A0A6G1JIV8_9PLEO|nr:hypothetical protein K458DRAFT_328219 [Lentithecium fluviatile CBS 122367]
MIEHIARRGIQHVAGMNMYKRAVEEGSKIEVPKMGIAVLVGSFIIMALFLSAVEYTLKDVVATLAMVETPSAAITISTPDEPASKDEKEGLLETAPTMTLVHQKPLTSSIRGTIKHLVSQGGRLARFRGFREKALWAFAMNVVANIANTFLPTFIPFRMVIVMAVAGAVTANLHAAWTHKIVSMPSATRFWQRIPARSQWKVLAFPAAVYAAMPYVSLYVAQGSIQLLRLNRLKPEDVREYNGAEWTSLIARFIAVIVIAFSCTLFLCLPAIVTMVRVEASILPEEEDTIVPFDRTFDGKVVSKVVGGTGSIGFLDAWKSFTWEARRRLLKLYVKVFFIIAGLAFILMHVWAVIGFVAMGPALGKAIAEARKNGY